MAGAGGGLGGMYWCASMLPAFAKATAGPPKLQPKAESAA